MLDLFIHSLPRPIGDAGARDSILWAYIVLLLVGGVFGLIKGKSKISLVTSVIFAGLLVGSILAPSLMAVPRFVPEILLGVLLVVFGIRLAKKKKFMPSGLMLVVTLLTLALRLIIH